MEKTYDFYFIQNVDIPSNATKMESLLLGFIRNTREHAVLELNALHSLKAQLERYQEEQLRQNPRLKPCGIVISDEQYHGLRWITVGRISVNCTKVTSIEK